MYLYSGPKENITPRASAMKDIFIRLIGWRAAIFHGDPTVYDRWKWIRRHLSHGTLRTLDVGCGSGAFTMYAAKIGNESVGISSDDRNCETAIKRANILGLKNIKIIQADLRDLDNYFNTLGTFDQIMCLETIEHILDDKKLISDLSTLLKPGGRLVLTAPFKYYKPLLGDKLSDREDGGHVRWGYTHDEMRSLFNQCRMDIIVEEYISGIISRQLTHYMRILGKLHARIAWTVIFPFRIFQVFDSSLTKLIGYPYLSIGVMGKKRE